MVNITGCRCIRLHSDSVCNGDTTNCMEHSTSWEANRAFSYSRKLPPFMEPEGSLPCSQKPPPITILSHTNPIHIPKIIFLRSILILSSHVRLGILSSLFPSWFSNQNFVCISHFPHTHYLPSLFRPRFHHLNTSSEEHKQWSSSLCSFLQSPVTSPDSKCYSRHPVVKHPQSLFFPNVTEPVSQP
jgi:hypothetical protein